MTRSGCSYRMLEGTECTAAWCSVDNWQPLTCGVYFLWGAESEQRRERSSIVQGERDYLNFSIDYLIRTMCLLSGVLRNTPLLKASAVK